MLYSKLFRKMASAPGRAPSFILSRTPAAFCIPALALVFALVLPFLLTHRGPEVSATTCCPLGPAQLPATPSSRTFQGSAAYRQGKSGYLAKGKERRCHQTVQAAPTALVPGAQERCGLVG